MKCYYEINGWFSAHIHSYFLCQGSCFEFLLSFIIVYFYYFFIWKYRCMKTKVCMFF